MDYLRRSKTQTGFSLVWLSSAAGEIILISLHKLTDETLFDIIFQLRNRVSPGGCGQVVRHQPLSAKSL
jgi:hypothetical protein